MNDKDSATNTYTLEFESEPDVLLDRLEELARDHSESAFELTVTREDAPAGAPSGERGGHPYRAGLAAPPRLRARLRAREREVEDNVAEAELVIVRDDGATVLTVEYVPRESEESSEERDEGLEVRSLMSVAAVAGLGVSGLLAGLLLTVLTLAWAGSCAADDVYVMIFYTALCFGGGALLLFTAAVTAELEMSSTWLCGYVDGMNLDSEHMWEFSPGVRIHRVLDHLRLAELQVDGEGATPREGDREFARGVKAARFAARAIAENAGF